MVRRYMYNCEVRRQTEGGTRCSLTVKLVIFIFSNGKGGGNSCPYCYVSHHIYKKEKKKIQAETFSFSHGSAPRHDLSC